MHQNNETIPKNNDEDSSLLDNNPMVDIVENPQCSISEEDSTDRQEKKKKKDWEFTNVHSLRKIVKKIKKELVDILRTLWKSCLKPLIILFFILWIVSSLWCSLAPLYFPKEFSSRCPSKKILFPQFTGISKNTVLLAKEFLHTDLNMSMDLIRTKTALVEIRSSIVHSQLEENLREELTRQLTELKELIVKGIEKSTILSASFQTTLDRVHIAIKFSWNNLEEMSESLTGDRRESKKRDGRFLLF